MAQFLGSPLVIIAAAAVTLLALAVPLWRMWVVYSGSSTRRPVDASAAGLQPSPEIAGMIADLSRLGFTRLGEAQLELPGMRAVELTATGDPRVVGPAASHHTIFVLVDAERTVVAETGQVPGAPVMVSLNSVFADSSVVETMFPRGESIEDPDFHSGHNNLSLDGAYRDQLAHVERWQRTHAAPRVYSSMADYLGADAVYRERYSKRVLRGPLIRRQLLPAALVVALVVGLAFFALSNWPG